MLGLKPLVLVSRAFAAWQDADDKLLVDPVEFMLSWIELELDLEVAEDDISSRVSNLMYRECMEILDPKEAR